jgi:hypothetical protein
MTPAALPRTPTQPPPPPRPGVRGGRPPRRAGRRRLLAVGVATAVVLCLALVVVGASKTHWAEELVRVYVERIASEALESHVTVGGVEIEPFRVAVALHDVEVVPPTGGRLLRVAEVRVNLAGFQTFAQVLAGKLHLDAIELRGPEVSLEMVDGRITNLPPPILRALAEPKKDEKRHPLELPARLDLLAIHEGTVRVNVAGVLLGEVGGIEVHATEDEDGGGFGARVHASSGGIDMATLHEPLRELTLEGSVRLAPLSAEVTVLRVATPRLALGGVGKGSLAAPDALPTVDGHASVSVPLDLVSDVLAALPVSAELRAKLDAVPALRGTVSIDASASGTFPDVKARASVEVLDVTAGKFSLEEASVRAALQDNGVRIEEAKVKVGPKGYGTVSGFVSIGGTFPFRVEAAAHDLSVGYITDRAGLSYIPVEVLGGGTATASGELFGPEGFHLEAAGEATADEVRVAMGHHATGPKVIDIFGAHATTNLRITDHLEIYGAHATVGDTAATGNIHIWPDHMDLHASVVGVGEARDAGLIAGRAFEGRGGGDVHVFGSYHDIEVTAAGSFTGVQMDKRLIGDVTGEMHYRGEVVSFAKMRIVRSVPDGERGGGGGRGHIDVPKLVYDMRDPRGAHLTADLALEGVRIEDLAGIAGVDAAAAKIGLTGTVGGWAHVEGPVALPDLQAGLALPEWTLLGETWGASEVDGSLAKGVLTVTRADVRKGAGGRIAGHGTLGAKGELDFDATVSALRLSDVELRAVRGLGVSGAVSGDVKVGGTTAAPALAGEARLALDGRGTLAATGRLDTAGEGAVEVRLEAAGLPLQDVLAALAARGDPERRAALVLPVPGGSVDADATLKGTLAVFTVDGAASANVGGGTVGAHGRVGSDLGLALAIDGTDVPLTAALRIALALADPTSGTWKNVPELPARASLKGRLDGARTAPRFDGAVDLDAGAGARAHASGTVDAAGALAMDVVATSLSLDEVVRLAVALVDPVQAPALMKKMPALAGRVDVKGRLGGGLDAPELNAHASAHGLAVAGVALGDADVDGTLDASRRLAVRGKALGGSAVDFGATMAGDFPFEGTVRFAGLDALAYAPRSARDVLPGLAVVADGTATLSGALLRLDEASGKAALSRLDVLTSAIAVGATERVDLTLKKGRLALVHKTTFGALDPAGGEPSTFVVGGRYDLGGDMAFTIDGDVGLALVAAFIPGGLITTANGRIEGIKARLGGTPLSPDMEGTGHIVGSALALSFFPHSLADFSGELALRSSIVEITDLAGTLTTGSAVVNGTIDLDTIDDPQIDLRVDVREADVRYIEDWPARIDGWLTVRGSRTSMLLQGDLEVVETRYTKDVDWKVNLEEYITKRRPHYKIVTVAAEPVKAGSSFLTLDIVLRAPEGHIYVKNNLADMEAYIDSSVTTFAIRGTDRNPHLEGIARAMPGSYITLYDKEFEVTRAEVSFEDKFKIDPEFDIEASSVIGEHTVYVTASGTVDDLSIVLRSEPPLMPDDIALLITLGVTRSDFESSLGGGGGDRTAGLVGGVITATGISDRVDKAFESVVPFDFGVGTRYSDSKGSYVPVVTASKRISKEWRFRGSTSFVDPFGDFEGGLEYKASKDVSIHGTVEPSTSSGGPDIGVDVKWKRKF